MEKEIWFIYPSQLDGNVTRLRQTIKEFCKGEGFIWQQRPLVTKRSLEGRRYNLLTPDDARNLYSRIHRSFVGVFLVGRAFVQNDPSQNMNYMSGLTQLSEHLRYKAFFRKLNFSDNHEMCRDSFSEFQRLGEEIGCEGDNDPRCLPFHVFENSTKYDLNLDLDADRRRFVRVHGAPTKRTDSRGLVWTSKVRHGKETIHVAGRELSTGFHWDVEHPQRGRQALKIYNSNQVWRLKKSGYVNVYPDAYIRKGEGSKRVWP